jgi:H+/Cl- antiporter ClcA
VTATEKAAAAPAGRVGDGAYLRLVLLAAALGIPAALVGAGFLALVHELEDAVWPDDPGWYLVLGLPVVGAGIVLAARRLLPGDGGHPPLQGLSAAPTPLAHAPGIVVAAVGTLAFGAVLGPEAPVIALGSVVGVALAEALRANARGRAVLSSAGSFSAMSALFGGPLVAGMLLVESGLGAGAALIPALLPGLVAAAIGYTLFVGLGDWGGLNAQGLAVPHLPAYTTTRVADLLVGLAVGVATALLVGVVKRGAVWLAAEGPRRLGPAGLLLGGALAVGALAVLADLLGDDPQDVLFSGQASVPAGLAESSAGLVIVLIVGKAVAYAVSLGCGFRGGPIFPAIFLGIALASLPVVWFGVSPTLAVAVGAAAGMAAQTRLIVSPLLFAGLLTGSAGVDAIPAAVLATAGAWLTATALAPASPAAGEADSSRTGASSPEPPEKEA